MRILWRHKEIKPDIAFVLLAVWLLIPAIILVFFTNMLVFFIMILLSPIDLVIKLFGKKGFIEYFD